MKPRAVRPWRLLPEDEENGWLPFAWLIYLPIFLAAPVARWRAGELGPGAAAATELAVVIFLLSYFRGQSYYLDAAVALALLSFVSTVAAARYLADGGPIR